MLDVRVGILRECARFVGFSAQPRSRVVRTPVPPAGENQHSM